MNSHNDDHAASATHRVAYAGRRFASFDRKSISGFAHAVSVAILALSIAAAEGQSLSCVVGTATPRPPQALIPVQIDRASVLASIQCEN